MRQVLISSILTALLAGTACGQGADSVDVSKDLAVTKLRLSRAKADVDSLSRRVTFLSNALLAMAVNDGQPTATMRFSAGHLECPECTIKEGTRVVLLAYDPVSTRALVATHGGGEAWVLRANIDAPDEVIRDLPSREASAGEPAPSRSRPEPITFSGTTSSDTRAFRVDDGWTLRWYTSASYFAVFAFNTNDELLAYATSRGEGGSTYVRRGGSVYLKITATAAWRVQITP